MLQGVVSTDSVEKSRSGKSVGGPRSIVHIGHLAKDVNWSDSSAVRELLQKRFVASSLPFEVRLRIYTDLMMVLSGAGFVINVEKNSDLKKMKNNVDMDTITSILLPEMDYKVTSTMC